MTSSRPPRRRQTWPSLASNIDFLGLVFAIPHSLGAIQSPHKENTLPKIFPECPFNQFLTLVLRENSGGRGDDWRKPKNNQSKSQKPRKNFVPQIQKKEKTSFQGVVKYLLLTAFDLAEYSCTTISTPQRPSAPECPRRGTAGATE